MDDDQMEVVVAEGEPKEKTFTQADVDRIITDRLKRAKLPDDYEALQEIAKDLEDYGFTGTVAEKKEALKVAKEQARVQKEIQEIEEEAENKGTSPELLKELRELKKELNEIKSERQAIKEQEAKARKEADEKEQEAQDFQRQVKELNEEYPDVDPSVLAKDDKFIKYASKYKGDLKDCYADYIELMGSAEQSIAEKFKRSESRSTGGGKNTPSSGGTKLTSEQQATLDDWNRKNPDLRMTPQEFAQS